MFTLPFRTTFFLVALTSALASADSSHGHVGRRRHHGSNLTERATHLGKRFDDTRFTYFAPGINACGGYDHPSDFIVALNTHQWDGGKHCFEEITVAYEGKKTKAKITDMCMECPYGAIDFSPSLFTYLVSGGFDQGIAYGSWSYGAAKDSKPKPTPEKFEEKPEKKIATSTKYTSTTTTSEATATFSTTSSYMSYTAALTATTTTATTPTTTTTTSTAPTGVSKAPSLKNGNLHQFNMAMIQLTELLLSASNNT